MQEKFIRTNIATKRIDAKKEGVGSSMLSKLAVT
jgi:hypothetical protein